MQQRDDQAGLYSLFEYQARRVPEAIAVEANGLRISYLELSRRSNHLAHHLRSVGVGTETLVAICCDRSVEMLVGILGVLKAGGAYLPLDLTYPQERLGFILSDAQPQLLLLPREEQRGRIEYPTIPVLCLDTDWNDIGGQQEQAPSADISPANSAYVMYTSGSTGRPKGVVMCHRALDKLLRWQQSVLPLAPETRVALYAPLGFDVSVQEIFSALSSGGTVVVVPEEVRGDPYGLREWLCREKAERLYLPALVLDMLAGTDVPDRGFELKDVITAGDQLRITPSIRRMFRNLGAARLHNQYGPTETHIVTQFTLSGLPDQWPELPPIGRAADHVEILVLDADRRPVPPGSPGELYVGGGCLAREYLRRSEATTERFVAHPLSSRPGARLYRTGDLVRRLPDGNLEFLGRLDRQVKIRGFRVEPGEVEAAINEHPDVRQVAVLGCLGPSLQKVLVAYVVPESDRDISAAGLRSFLAQKLPEYMIPAKVVFLGELPATANGKVDYRILPQPDWSYREDNDTGYAAPRSETERTVAAIWTEVLGVHGVGVNDDFFELGGCSMTAALVLTRIRDRFGVAVAQRSFFERPSVAGLAESVGCASAGNPERTNIPRRCLSQAPLTAGQREIWLFSQIWPQSAAHNTPFTIRMRETVLAGPLERALREIIRRHEILRTRFVLEKGQPVQVVCEHTAFHLREFDLESLPVEERETQALELATVEAREPFDLACLPLMRASLVRLDTTDCRLYLTLHHIVTDAFSVYAVLVPELASLYRSYCEGKPSQLADPVLQYTDYTLWQQEQLQSEEGRERQAHWRKVLQDASPVRLPTDHRRPATPGFQGAFERFFLAGELSEQLKKVGRGEQATLFMTLLAAYKVLLWRWSGQNDITVGTVEAGRGGPELEALPGYFLNQLVVRTDLEHDPPFRLLVSGLRDCCLEGYDHAVPSLDELLQNRDTGSLPNPTTLFRNLFVMEPSVPRYASGWTISQLDVQTGATSFELAFELEEREEGIIGRLIYDTDLFEAETIRQLLTHYEALLRSIVADPDCTISKLPVSGNSERNRVISEWNRTGRTYPSDKTVPELFQRQVQASPGELAVTDGRRRLTYAELDLRARRVASFLVSKGITPGGRVGISLERSTDLIVGLLGILQAGAAYVPLEPDYPQERLAFMTRDAQLDAILTDSNGPIASSGQDVPIFDLGSVECVEQVPQVGSTATARSAAYLLYTSGSTGQPKGVVISHQAIVRLVVNPDYLQIEPSDRVAQASNCSFDAATFEIWGALLNGAALVIVPRTVALSPEGLTRFIREQQVSVLFLTTAWFHEVVRTAPDAFRSLRALLVGGESMSPQRAREVLQAAGPERFLNVYGPTESATFTTWYAVKEVPENASSVPIGRPIANTRVYVLDRHLSPVPIGIPGELFITGDGLASGYWSRPELTAAKFIQDPFAPGQRMYRTGDLVRYRPDGNLEFLGRLDNQIKLRGFRVELEEVESVLQQHPGIRAAAAVADDNDGDKLLAAYYVCAPGQQLSARELLRFAQLMLPDFMVPRRFLHLESLPLTPNGKIDRDALRLLPAAEPARVIETPKTSVESSIASIWEELLHVESVDRRDNFFDLGGHSLVVARLVSRMEGELGVRVPLQQIFETPVLADLAAAIPTRRSQTEVTSSRAGTPPGNPRSLSAGQEQLWFLDQLEPNSPVYNISEAWHLEGELDPKALERALAALVDRHEILRTTFHSVEGHAVQIVAPAVEVHLEALDLSRESLSADSDVVRQKLRQMALRPFDLSQDLMLRAALLRLGEKEHLLLISTHHIASDGWSRQILYGELAELYNCFAESREPSLPALPFQYADYADRQRAWLQSPAFTNHLDYWKKVLTGIPPPLEIPADYTRPARQDFFGGVEEALLTATQRQGLEKLGHQRRATLFMVLLGVFQLLLHRLTGQADISIGTAVANRTDSDTEKLIGFFVNTLVLRTDLSGNPSFLELLSRVRAAALGAYTHQAMPFDRLVAELRPERNLSRNPLFDVMINFTNLPLGKVTFSGLEVSPLQVEELPSHFGMTLHLAPTEEGLRLQMVYQRALFAPGRVRTLLEQYCSLMQQVMADPSREIMRYSVKASPGPGSQSAPRLPGTRSRAAGGVSRTARESLRIPETMSADLRAFCDRFRVTPAEVLLAVLKILLCRYTGSGEFAIDMQVPDGARRSVAQISHWQSFRDLLVGASPSAGQVPPPGQRYPIIFHFGCWTPSPSSEPSQLTMEVRADLDRLQLLFDYDTAAQEPTSAQRMLHHYQVLLTNALQMPDQTVFSLPILTDSERKQLLQQWNATEFPYPRDRVIHELFEMQVARAHDAVAVISEDQQLTYSELNDAANRLAHHLVGLAVGPETLVGLCLERSPEMVTAMLAILKAGGAYVPLDPRYPANRLSEIIEDADLSVIISREGLSANLPSHIQHLVCLDRDRVDIEGCPSDNLRSSVSPENLAYVLFTSGSTGKPKGVLVEHRSLVNYVAGVSRNLGLCNLRSFAMVQPLTVDSCVTALYPPLVNGGCLHVITEERALDASGLAEYFSRHRIDCLKIAPSHLSALHAAGGRVMPLQVLIIGGEASRWEAVGRFQSLAPKCRIYNHYGPTEATVGVIAFATAEGPGPEASGMVPIGRPLPNTVTYILDVHLQPVPVGTVGELYVGGDCLARGYLKRPELTEACFLPNPFSEQTGARIYRTGDQARYLPDGNIEFLGRRDSQVKVRGFRVELGEVESAIARHPAVQDVAVTTHNPRSGGTQLIAYVVRENNSELSESALREFLNENIPAHLVPSIFCFADALPRTPHGKLDRAALSGTGLLSDVSKKARIAPRDLVETRLTEIWEQTLGVRPVGMRDNFFYLGGHSLLAVTLFAKIERRFGKKLPLRVLFEAPTIEHLAEVLRRDGWAPKWSSLVPIQPAGSRPPLFFVHAAQGNVLFYADLARNLGSDQPVYGLQSAGLDGHRHPYASVEEMAAAYIGELQQVQPDGPYYLGGFCSGAYVALEMAHQLQQRGDQVSLLVSFATDGAWKNVDTFVAGISYHWRNLLQLGLWSKCGYVATRVRYRVARIAGKIFEIADRLSRALGRPLPHFLLLPYLEEANRRAIRLYQPHRYRGTMVYLQGSDEPFRDPMPFWGDLVEKLEIHRVPGSGMMIFREPHAQVLADRIRMYLKLAEQPAEKLKTPPRTH